MLLVKKNVDIVVYPVFDNILQLVFLVLPTTRYDPDRSVYTAPTLWGSSPLSRQGRA